MTDLVMEVNMTATLAARETWCAGVTTVSSSGNITTQKTTAVRSPQCPPPPPLLPAVPPGLEWVGELGAALPSGPVARVRPTVTMTGTAGAISCAGTTTVAGLASISTTRTTAVKNQQPSSLLHLHQSHHSQDLVRGVPGGTTVGGDVVLQSSHVRRERETVTDLVMEDSMMETRAARES